MNYSDRPWMDRFVRATYWRETCDNDFNLKGVYDELRKILSEDRKQDPVDPEINPAPPCP